MGCLASSATCLKGEAGVVKIQVLFQHQKIIRKVAVYNTAVCVNLDTLITIQCVSHNPINNKIEQY